MDTKRAFFALWPGEALRQAVQKQFKQSEQYQLPGKRMLPSNFHLTLDFIGEVDAEQLDCLITAARTVQAEPFDLVLDHYGYFEDAKIVWLGCRNMPKALATLQQKLSLALQNCGYEAEERAFTPHITLLRKCREAGVLPQPEPLTWRVNGFALVESVPVAQGVQYRPIEKYLFT